MKYRYSAVAVVATLITALKSPAVPPPDFVVRADSQRLSLNQDQFVDRVQLDPAWSATEAVYGRILLLDGEGSRPPRSIVGTEAGDAFGIAACSIGDINADGVDDIAVAAPGAGVKTDATMGLRSQIGAALHPSLYGRVCLISGATGEGLATLHGLPQEMSCWGVARLHDVDGDGIDDLLIRSFVLASGQASPDSVARYTVVSTASGLALDTGLESELFASLGVTNRDEFWNAKNLRQIRRGVAADLNADGVVDGTDLVEQIGNLGQTGDNMGRGDLDTDDAIDGADIAITIGSIGQSVAVNAPTPTPAQFNPCKSNPGANCYLCPVGGTCDSNITPNPVDIDDGGGGGGGVPGEPDPCATSCGPPPCVPCQPPCAGCPPPGEGCPPPDVNCNGQPDPRECEAYYQLDARTDSNNDNQINGDDDTNEDNGLGRVLCVHSEALNAPLDVARIVLVKTPASISRWRVDSGGMTIIQPEGATPIVSGVWYQTGMPASFSVAATLPGSVRFQVTVDTGGPCGRKSDSVDLFAISPVFKFPAGFQTHQRFLAVLPGDASPISFDHGLPSIYKVLHYTSSRQTSRFVDRDDALVRDVAGSSSIDSLEYFSSTVGDEYLEVRRGNASGQLLARKLVRVGGSIKIKYDRVPTFKVSVSDNGDTWEPVQHPGSGDIGALPGGISMGGGPIYQNGRNLVRPALIDAANNAPQAPAKFTVRVLDSDEQPLGKRKVRFIPKDGMLRKVSSGGANAQEAPSSGEANMTGFTADTNAEGVATFDLLGDDAKVRAKPLVNFPNLPWQERGVAVERVGVLVGRCAKTQHLPSEELRAQYFTAATLAFRNLAFTSGAGFTMDAEVKATGADAEKYLFHLFEVPLGSHTQLTILKHWLEGPIIFTSDVPGSIVAPLWIYNSDGTLPENPIFEEMSHVGLLTALSLDQRLAIFQSHIIGPSHIEWLNQGEAPLTDEMLSVLTSVGAGAAEIAWGFVPIAPDLLDLGKEAFWQPVVNEQNPDYWVVAFSAFGLLSDAGYIALPAGAVGNAAAAVGKFIARLEKRFPGLVRGIVTGAGSVAASARAIADYAKRIPAPPGGDTIDHAVEMVFVMVRQSVRVLTLPGVAVDRAVEAITLVWRRAGSAWGDEAVEGVALVCKRCFPQAVAADGGCDWLARRLIDVYGDDIAKKTLEITRKLPLDDPSMTAEAIEGVAVALKARAGDPLRVKQFVESAVIRESPVWLVKTLENIRELDEIEGLNRMVNELGFRSHGANYLLGTMYEAEVARRIKSGQIPGSGELLRVAVDYSDETKKIDTLTASWAAQVKHSTELNQFDINDIRGSDLQGEAYIVELRSQAIQSQRSPVLITNRPATPELQTLLGQLGIEHRVIESPFP